LLRRQKEQSTAFSKLPDIPARAADCIYAELQCENEELAAEQLFSLGALLAESGGNPADTWVARMPMDLDQLHFFRHAVPESANMLIDQRKKVYPSITKLGTDMSVPDGRLTDVMALYRVGLSEYGLQSAIWGHIGDNHLHVNILPRNETDYIKGKALYQQWAQAITNMGGAVAAEHGVGKLKVDFLAIMYGEKHIAEMAAFKYAFDPKGVLGAGNLFIVRKGEKKD
jgi:D-lactate dehydrogenase (cytochrome)